jgi:hypothetical protein
MNLNLRDLTSQIRKEREAQMKRHLLPFTALPMKEAAFTILCCTVLMLFASAAWADQCSAPTVGVGTGVVGFANGTDTCGAVIIVSAVDGTGKATSFTVLAAGNGNPYDGTEDTLIGVQNSSGATLNSIPLSGTNIFGFDGDGPCNTVYHTPPYSWCPATYADPVGYEGPDNTFSRDGSNSGTVTFTTGIGDGGSTWFALEGTPQSISGTTVTTTLSTMTTTADFNTNTHQTIDYSHSNLNFSNITVQETFLPISDSAYSKLVAGTFAQGSKCMPQDITGAGTTFACAGVIVLCKGPTDTSFAGLNCPRIPPGTGFINVKEKYLTNAFPANGSGQVPSPGYLQATDNALNCNNDPSNTCRGLANMFTAIAEDCCGTSGSPPLHFNSLLIPNYCLGYNITSVDEYNVVGFSSPVDNPGSGSSPIVNLINSKQAVPMKLTVGALPAPCSGGAPFTNLDLVGSTNPATIHTVVLSATNATVCNGNAVFDPTPTTTAAGNSGWQILGNGVYQFNWKPAAPVGSCLAFSVNLGDGVQHTAYFKIAK